MRPLYRMLHLKSKVMMSQNVCKPVTCKKIMCKTPKMKESYQRQLLVMPGKKVLENHDSLSSGEHDWMYRQICLTFTETTSTDCLNSIEKWFILKGPWVNFKMSKCPKGQMVQRWVTLSACLTDRIIEESLYRHCTNTAKLQKPMLEFMTHNTTYIL